MTRAITKLVDWKKSVTLSKEKLSKLVENIYFFIPRDKHLAKDSKDFIRVTFKKDYSREFHLSNI